jgi:hypothetical protein
MASLEVEVHWEPMGERWNLWCPNCLKSTRAEFDFALFMAGMFDRIFTLEACSDCDLRGPCRPS